MLLGIDLGTTFCCVAYVDEEGVARLVPSSDGESTTPSVIWFDGRNAWVGQKANAKKQQAPESVYEFVKRNIGRGIDDPVAAYNVGGYRWGAAGMSAIILRKLKKDAVRLFKKQGLLHESAEEKTVQFDTIITVPAHFGDKHRQETALAAYAAGLDVAGIINEPTAAALTFAGSAGRRDFARVMVFDLGGGTCDVTILEMRGDEATVLASTGNQNIGGKDWDLLIVRYIQEFVRRTTGGRLPDERVYEVQQLAVGAKHELTDSASTSVPLTVGEHDLEIPLSRGGSGRRTLSVRLPSGEAFDFEMVSTELLSRCEALCSQVLQETQIESASGRRGIQWDDLDQIVLAGSASRMPMIAAMLQRISGREIKSDVSAFNPDTAVAIGAALYGHNRARVNDVVAHAIGITVEDARRRRVIDHLIQKNDPKPTRAQRTYNAPANALLEIHEGEDDVWHEATIRGRLELNNVPGVVTVAMEIDVNGRIVATAEQAGSPPRRLEIRNEQYRTGERAEELRRRVQAVTVNL
jgi:molecular chaperone DnaK